MQRAIQPMIGIIVLLTMLLAVSIATATPAQASGGSCDQPSNCQTASAQGSASIVCEPGKAVVTVSNSGTAATMTFQVSNVGAVDVPPGQTRQPTIPVGEGQTVNITVSWEDYNPDGSGSYTVTGTCQGPEPEPEPTGTADLACVDHQLVATLTASNGAVTFTWDGGSRTVNSGTVTETIGTAAEGQTITNQVTWPGGSTAPVTCEGPEPPTAAEPEPEPEPEPQPPAPQPDPEPDEPVTTQAPPPPPATSTPQNEPEPQPEPEPEPEPTTPTETETPDSGISQITPPRPTLPLTGTGELPDDCGCPQMAAPTGDSTSSCDAACRCIIIVGLALALGLAASHLLARRRTNSQHRELLSAITPADSSGNDTT